MQAYSFKEGLCSLRSENRKYIRFEPQDNTYAALGNHFSRVGKLTDISIGGLAFKYIENTESYEPNATVVSIFHSEDSFFLHHIGCRLIYDRPLYVKTEISDLKQKYMVKKCGVAFTAIEPHQTEKLNYFLNNYTRGLLPDPEELNLLR